MISDLFDYADIVESENFGIKKYKGSYYRGELDLESGKRQG